MLKKTGPANRVYLVKMCNIYITILFKVLQKHYIFTTDHAIQNEYRFKTFAYDWWYKAFRIQKWYESLFPWQSGMMLCVGFNLWFSLHFLLNYFAPVRRAEQWLFWNTNRYHYSLYDISVKAGQTEWCLIRSRVCHCSRQCLVTQCQQMGQLLPLSA